MINIFKKTKPFLQVYFHDIKNKLGSIKFSLSLLKNPKISEHEKETIIDSTIITTDKTIDMLNDYLELERYKSDKFLTNEKINITELIKEIIDELEIDIKRKNILINFRNSSENIIIKTNKKWLKKALLNIIHNSIKYNYQNGYVIISIDKEKKGIIVTVQDSGIGMSEEEKQYVFKKFYTTDNKSGTGIGLSMAKTVIESFGGAIKIESEKGLGTKFYIYLPYIAKSIKLRRLAFSLSGLIIFLFLGINYFFCLIPQKITKTVSNNLIIYKLENGIIAKTNINDKIKIIAKKNLFNTKTKTEFILSSADIDINTNNNPIKLIAGDLVLKNMGTQFETIKQDTKLASSVYKGAIKSQNMVINHNEGLLSQNGVLKKEPLPKKPENVNINEDNTHTIILNWSGNYNLYILTLSKDKNFVSPPIVKLQTTKKFIKLNNIPDGKWYANIQSSKDDLFSLPTKIEFLSLRDYYTALEYYDQNQIDIANLFLNKSLDSINKASSKPYLLKAKILLKNKNYKEALNYAKEAFNINKSKENLLIYAKTLIFNKKYKKAIKILNSLKPDITEKNKLLGICYFKLKDFNKAKIYLFKYLEEKRDKEVLQILLEILKKEKNYFLINEIKNLMKG